MFAETLAALAQKAAEDGGCQRKLVIHISSVCSRQDSAAVCIDLLPSLSRIHVKRISKVYQKDVYIWLPDIKSISRSWPLFISRSRPQKYIQRETSWPSFISRSNIEFVQLSYRALWKEPLPAPKHPVSPERQNDFELFRQYMAPRGGLCLLGDLWGDDTWHCFGIYVGFTVGFIYQVPT